MRATKHSRRTELIRSLILWVIVISATYLFYRAILSPFRGKSNEKIQIDAIENEDTKDPEIQSNDLDLDLDLDLENVQDNLEENQYFPEKDDEKTENLDSDQKIEPMPSKEEDPHKTYIELMETLKGKQSDDGTKFDGLGYWENQLHEFQANEEHLELVLFKLRGLQKMIGEVEKRQTNIKRAESVREGFLHAITGYFQHASGHDEIRPETNETNDSWGGLGITLVDSLDTMCIMGFDDLIEKSKGILQARWRQRFETSESIKVSFFETTIRHLGGLLAAFSCTSDYFFVGMALDIGNRLAPAFTSPSGFPYHEVDLITKEVANARWTNFDSILSEVGSVQLEFAALSRYSKDEKFREMSEKSMDKILERRWDDEEIPEGLYPVFLNIENGEPSTSKNLVSIGGLGDSFYEYLLKMYVFSNDQDEKKKYEIAHLQSLQAVIDHLLEDTDEFTYMKNMDLNGQYRSEHLFEHLQCFYPGVLALHCMKGPKYSELDCEKLIGIAERMLDTCVSLYDTSTGLSPDSVMFDGSSKFRISEKKNILRPETIESLFLMKRYYFKICQTSEGSEREILEKKIEKLEDDGWKIFEAFEKHCKTKSAYTGLSDVTKGTTNNSMQSFFLSETLKYLYLLFIDDEKVIDLNKFVFTTEGHPLRI